MARFCSFMWRIDDTIRGTLVLVYYLWGAAGEKSSRPTYQRGPGSVTHHLSLPKTSSGVTECDSCANRGRDVRVPDQAPARRAIPSEVAVPLVWIPFLPPPRVLCLAIF